VAEAFAKAKDNQALTEGLAETAAGARRVRRGRITSLALGGFQHRRLVMNEANGNRIGLGLLARYVVTFDFPSMKMYLQKGLAFDKPDETDMSGLHLWVVKGQATVRVVDKDSPAETAGIRADDVILKVGQQSAAKVDIIDLRELLMSGDGKEIKLTIKRGEEEKVASFRLKRKI
jgi:C-terminal processing protease CtpA/Prc